MRFAWLRKQAGIEIAANQGCINLIRMPYNAAWLLPIILTFTGTLDTSTGFIAFTIITLVRLAANLYRNNALSLVQAITFPFQA